MAKAHSDVFICKTKKGEYWAHPSPFVAHGTGTEVQFRNLTGEAIEIDFVDAPLSETTLSLAANATRSVTVNSDAAAGMHEYVAHVVHATPTPAKALAKTPAAARKVRRSASTPRRTLVKGGSSPKIIIDT